MDSRNSKSRFEAAITLLSRPQLLLQGTVEFLLAWSFTRGWSRLLLVHAWWILLLVGITGLVGYGMQLSRQTLGQRYSDWVAEELPEALRSTDENAPSPVKQSAKQSAEKLVATAVDNSDGNASEAEPAAESTADDSDQVSRYGELLLRRLLQLQDSNSRITYLVAAQLARQDRLAQARQMMRRIAPSDVGGFAPAHHWLAGDQLYHRSLRTLEDRERLMKDLSIATRWGGCHPALRNLFSQLLESQGKVPQAMAVLEQETDSSSQLDANLAIARLAAKHGQQGRFERAAQDIKQEVQSRVDAETVTIQDLAVLANLLLFEQKPAEARAAAESGLKKVADDPQLRRLLSESYRIEFLLSIRQDGGQTKLKLGLLDAALKSDPTNPSVGTEIARLMNLGLEATPELKNALEQQLAAGQATAVTHILLANRQLVSGELEAAVPHLELALRQAPNNPTIMNNLGLALSRTDQQPERAEQLVTAAVTSDPNNADFRDTLGEVRARKGDKLGAIECYEAAIGLNAGARSTRQKLAELYRELGMREMAEVQDRELQRLANEVANAPAKESPEIDAPAIETPAIETPESETPKPEVPAQESAAN